MHYSRVDNGMQSSIQYTSLCIVNQAQLIISQRQMKLRSSAFTLHKLSEGVI